jgi:uncharacterized SAM-binding protein YcdF (DUF218 family)
LFYVLSKILDLLLTPLVWALLLLAFALPGRRASKRSRRRKRALGVAGIGVLLFFSLGYVENALWWRLEHTTHSTYRPEVAYDVVVLLGGVGDERVWALTGEPSLNDNVERVFATHRILRDGHARYAIVSGGVEDPALARFNEAAMLAGILRDWGTDAERVIVEDQAKNTRENAVLSAEIIRARGFRRVLVVTSAFHLPRSADCFRAVGLEVDLLAADHRAHPSRAKLAEFLPRAEAFQQSTAAIRELTGRWIYRARGYGKGP